MFAKCGNAQNYAERVQRNTGRALMPGWVVATYDTYFSKLVEYCANNSTS
jgi:hypothetical protein